MPLLAAGLAIVCLIIYGAVELYLTAAGAFGRPAGIGAVVLAAALCAALIAALVRRYHSIHGRTVKGERILSTQGAWGKIRIDAKRKQGSLAVNGGETGFIFADIADVQSVIRDGTWTVLLRLKHNAQTEWQLPMKDRRQARHWAKIIALAAEQNL